MSPQLIKQMTYFEHDILHIHITYDYISILHMTYHMTSSLTPSWKPETRFSFRRLSSSDAPSLTRTMLTSARFSDRIDMAACAVSGVVTTPLYTTQTKRAQQKEREKQSAPARSPLQVRSVPAPTHPQRLLRGLEGFL